MLSQINFQNEIKTDDATEFERYFRYKKNYVRLKQKNYTFDNIFVVLEYIVTQIAFCGF